MIDDLRIRHEFADLIRRALDLLAQDHFDALTQEPPLTARAGERLENLQVVGLPEGFKFKIITLDIPDRGWGALEKETGTDLYVGVEVTFDGRRTSKGFLVQAKWDDPRSPAEANRLADQCDTMLGISDNAYVWSYGKEGVKVEKAQAFSRGTEGAGGLTVRDIGELFDAVLECTEGDQGLGLPEVDRPRAALGDMIERVRAQRGVAFQIEAHRP
jgi:hypothetical protein